MSWDEEFVREARSHFLTISAEFSHCQFLGKHEQPLEKTWRFATGISNFQKASSQCNCGVVHQSFRGKTTRLIISFRNYSRIPQTFGTALMQVHHNGRYVCARPVPSIIPWAEGLRAVPLHPPMRYSHIPDGASLVYSALWPIPYIADILKPLRDSLRQLVFHHRLDLKLRHHISQKTNTSPFDETVKAQNLEIFSGFIHRLGLTVDESIPADQPFRLSAFKQLTNNY